MKISENISISGKFTFIFRNIITGKIRKSIYDNLVVNTGKQMLAKRLANVANACNVTYCAVGTGVTAPNVNDTTLGTEYFRKVVSTYSYVANIATVSTFIGASEGNTALKEVGLFGEAASATPNSGTLFNRAVINETKSSSETLTIDCDITFS